MGGSAIRLAGDPAEDVERRDEPGHHDQRDSHDDQQDHRAEVCTRLNGDVHRHGDDARDHHAGDREDGTQPLRPALRLDGGQDHDAHRDRDEQDDQRAADAVELAVEVRVPGGDPGHADQSRDDEERADGPTGHARGELVLLRGGGSGGSSHLYTLFLP